MEIESLHRYRFADASRTRIASSIYTTRRGNVTRATDSADRGYKVGPMRERAYEVGNGQAYGFKEAADPQFMLVFKVGIESPTDEKHFFGIRMTAFREGTTASRRRRRPRIRITAPNMRRHVVGE